MSGSERNLQNSEFARLKNICYLDHIGAGLYADSQLEAVLKELKNTLFSNPHSSSFSGTYCQDVIDQIRFMILEHFGTTAEEYDVVFTSGATQSLKTVVELFDWSNSRDEEVGCLIYTRDNHTSVLGLRELVDHGAVGVHCMEHNEACRVFKNCSSPSKRAVGGNSLFVYSAQCNFSGYKYPLTWINKVHDGILDEFVGANKKWFCLLDAASFVPTNELNLTQYPADFVALSFYKMFGYPSGLGALIVRKSSSHVLKKRYYGGGTILMALSDDLFHKKRENISEKFEDGTVNYLAILSLRHGFDTLRRLGGNMQLISTKVFSLAQYLHDKLLTLHHSNGNAAVKLYHDSDYSDFRSQGGVVNFNLLRDDMQYVGYLEVLHITNLFGIQIRTGCFCNPGACQRHLNLTNEQLKENFQKGHSCSDHIDLIDGYPTGSVRVSFGYASTQADADKLLATIIECFVSKPAIFKTPATWIEEARTLKAKFEYYNHTSLVCNSNNVIAIEPENEKRTLKSAVPLDAKLLKIFLYPIKSCGAFEVRDTWPLTKSGLKYDREWMIITANGVALTQKLAPQMCLIVPDVCLIRQTMTLEFKQPNRNPNSSITIRIQEVSVENSEMNRIRRGKVCGDQVTFIDWGDGVAEWLQSVLQMPGLRLVKGIKRRSTRKDRPNSISLSNQAQYLLITKSSINWLEKNMSSSIILDEDNLMKRFRSNFVIEGNIEALEEFRWKRVHIGNIRFEVAGACSRCSMICIDQSSGEKHREPLTRLASAFEGKIKFGIYLTLLEMIGPLNVKIGDHIAIELSNSSSEIELISQ